MKKMFIAPLMLVVLAGCLRIGGNSAIKTTTTSTTVSTTTSTTVSLAVEMGDWRDTNSISRLFGNLEADMNQFFKDAGLMNDAKFLPADCVRINNSVSDLMTAHFTESPDPSWNTITNRLVDKLNQMHIACAQKDFSNAGLYFGQALAIANSLAERAKEISQ